MLDSLWVSKIELITEGFQKIHVVYSVCVCVCVLVFFFFFLILILMNN